MLLWASQMALWLATALCAAATVLYAYHLLTKRRSFSVGATWMTGAAFLVLTASVGLRSSATGGTELNGPNSLVLAAWAVVLVYFVVEHLVRLKVYGTVLVPVGLVLLLAAQLTGINQTWQLAPDKAALLESWQVGIHVFLIVLANAGFGIGGVASAAYLVLEKQLKRHSTSTLFKRLPSLAQTDQVARRAVAFALPAYTAGILLGVLRAVDTDVLGWWADARIVLAGIVWVIFSAYTFLRYGRGLSGRASAVIALVGLVVVIALFIVARTLPVGFHIWAVRGA